MRPSGRTNDELRNIRFTRKDKMLRKVMLIAVMKLLRYKMRH